MPQILKERIKEVRRLSGILYEINVESPYVSSLARAGQFVNVKCCEGLNALLRRPISICDVNAEKGTFSIAFQVKGEGTAWLSRKKAGDELDFIGPLGNSFDISEEFNNIAVVGGGIGIFPLYFLLKSRNWVHGSAFLGFRSREYVVMEDDFKKAADSLEICTDDGSYGSKALVTERLERELEFRKYDAIYTCGPLPMIRKVAETAGQHGIRCQVSLEQRMGCGVGACLVCACKTKLGDGWEYSHVCKDGPVFWSEEVILE